VLTIQSEEKKEQIDGRITDKRQTKRIIPNNKQKNKSREPKHIPKLLVTKGEWF